LRVKIRPEGGFLPGKFRRPAKIFFFFWGGETYNGTPALGNDLRRNIWLPTPDVRETIVESPELHTSGGFKGGGEGGAPPIGSDFLKPPFSV